MNLNEFVRGWIIGDFEPSVLRTKDLDFGVEFFRKGDKHLPHYHKICTEYVIIVSGEHILGEKAYKKGDICIIRPYESFNYECVKTGAVAVVKVPTGKGDKYEDTKNV